MLAVGLRLAGGPRRLLQSAPVERVDAELAEVALHRSRSPCPTAREVDPRPGSRRGSGRRDAEAQARPDSTAGVPTGARGRSSPKRRARSRLGREVDDRDGRRARAGHWTRPPPGSRAARARRRTRVGSPSPAPGRRRRRPGGRARAAQGSSQHGLPHHARSIEHGVTRDGPIIRQASRKGAPAAWIESSVSVPAERDRDVGRLVVGRTRARSCARAGPRRIATRRGGGAIRGSRRLAYSASAACTWTSMPIRSMSGTAPSASRRRSSWPRSRSRGVDARLVERRARVVEQRDEEAVDDEARACRCSARPLAAGRSSNVVGRGVRLVVGQLRAHDLDQRHQRRRVEEVQADDSARAGALPPRSR